MCNLVNTHAHTKCRKERVGSVAANPDNLESNKEAGGGAQGTQGSSKNCTSRESVSPLFAYDSITVSYARELTSLSMRYSQGEGVNTSLSRITYYTHVLVYSCV